MEGIPNSDQASNAVWCRKWLPRSNKKHGLRWRRWRCYCGLAEWHWHTRWGTNTLEGQREWCRLPKRSRRDNWSGYWHVMKRDEEHIMFCTTRVVPRMCSFLILSLRVTPPIHHSIPISCAAYYCAKYWARTYQGKWSEKKQKIRWKDAFQRYMKRTGARAGEEMNRATWSRKIIDHPGDTIRWENLRVNKKIYYYMKLTCQRNVIIPHSIWKWTYVKATTCGIFWSKLPK